MKPTITFQCSKEWESLRIEKLHRYCSQCELSVIDFTQMEREEIIEYLFEHRNEKVCGRIQLNQLDYSHEEQLITVQKLLRKNPHNAQTFFLLALGTTLLLSCAQPNNIEDGDISLKDSVCFVPQVVPRSDSTSTPRENLRAKQKVETVAPPKASDTSDIDTLVLPEGVTVGDIVLTTNTLPNGHEVLLHQAEQMPAFPGGLDSLLAFIQENTVYPMGQLPIKNARVYVRFVVDTLGQVVLPEVIRGVGPNFDKAALDVVSKMPRWIPAVDKGKKVAVYYIIPIGFSST